MIVTNWDALAQWYAMGYIGTYLRKDVWEQDLKQMVKNSKDYDKLRGQLIG
jgi:hypothetical protein